MFIYYIKIMGIILKANHNAECTVSRFYTEWHEKQKRKAQSMFASLIYSLAYVTGVTES